MCFALQSKRKCDGKSHPSFIFVGNLTELNVIEPDHLIVSANFFRFVNQLIANLVCFVSLFYFNPHPALNITTAVYNITTITNHLSISNGKDFTIKAAINTATIDGMAIPIAAFLL